MPNKLIGKKVLNNYFSSFGGGADLGSRLRVTLPIQLPSTVTCLDMETTRTCLEGKTEKDVNNITNCNRFNTESCVNIEKSSGDGPKLIFADEIDVGQMNVGTIFFIRKAIFRRLNLIKQSLVLLSHFDVAYLFWAIVKYKLLIEWPLKMVDPLLFNYRFVPEL